MALSGAISAKSKPCQSGSQFPTYTIIYTLAVSNKNLKDFISEAQLTAYTAPPIVLV
jgi:hypothetical protein